MSVKHSIIFQSFLSVLILAHYHNFLFMQHNTPDERKNMPSFNRGQYRPCPIKHAWQVFPWTNKLLHLWSFSQDRYHGILKNFGLYSKWEAFYNFSILDWSWYIKNDPFQITLHISGMQWGITCLAPTRNLRTDFFNTYRRSPVQKSFLFLFKYCHNFQNPVCLKLLASPTHSPQ